MKILFIQHKDFINGSGGTEKICSFLANHFTALNYQVEIATNQNIVGEPMFPLDSNIKVTNIFNSEVVQKSLYAFQNYEGKNPLLWLRYKIEKKYLKFLNKSLCKKMGGPDGLFQFNLKHRSEAWKKYIDLTQPDLIITMSIGSLLEISYKNEYTIPIINSVNGRPDYDYSDILWHRSEKEMSLLKNSYRKLSGIQILFDSYKNFLPETFQSECITIPNPVPQITREETINHLNKKDRYKIINIASLATNCKQQDIAINIFSKLAHKYPDWDLYFWGVGEDYNFLNNQIEKAGLKDRIFLKGFTDNPLQQLKNSDIFIFPSKYEGFPLALTEAMSAGLPTIGFKSCSGVNELIKHKETGFLSIDETEMSNHLETLIRDSAIRQTLGGNANLAMKDYERTNVSAKWETFVNRFI